ncbi:hypothetical protein [Enterobacter ludwigii]|uniref:hypothetical protein n=1 Tax=Enterobacter ludwigii TaxID=299767 RepID=UPI001639F39A|nr:hypothetical protein [Enterobacter ludwigii]MBK1519193.1 hypothetical protein [Enterobacter ludwigii]
MSVTRYELTTKYRGNESWDELEENPEGAYVRHGDYAALEQRLIESERYGRQTDITIDNLEMKLAQMAAENAYLLPKAASELSNAWVLHKYLIGIQAAIMYLDNGNKKAAQDWLYGTIAGPGFEFPDGVDDIDAWATHQMRGSVSHQQALEIIKAETPSTDAYLAEVRAQGVEMFAEHCQKRRSEMMKSEPNEAASNQAITATRRAGEFAMYFAAQFRKGVQS